MPTNNHCSQNFNPLSPSNNCCDNSFSDRTYYFEDAESLRNYIIERESKRKLEDLANVEDGIGNYAEGQILTFDATRQLWTIVEGFEPVLW